MTSESLKDFKFNGDPRDPDYWWEIINTKYQGYDPEDDGMVTVPVKHLEDLQQAYVQAICGLEVVADKETGADVARRTLKELRLGL